MKKILFLVLAVGIGLTGMTQNLKNRKAIEAKKISGFEQTITVNPEYQLTAPPKDAAVIGTTINYDFQTNSSMQTRLNIHDDGTMSAGWIMSFDESMTDRGTGFNYYDGSAWGAPPTARIESEKTGWPAILDLGHDVVIAHGPLDGSVLKAENSAFGADDWSESYIPPATGYENVWPRSVVGGADGNTIHMIGNYYTEYKLGYYRSTDGGQTWDIQGVQIDGLGDDKYFDIGGDDYAIAAKGETVAIAVFSTKGDVAVVKSTDNGDSWTRYTVVDFPDELEPFDPANDVFDMDEDGNPDTVSKPSGCGEVMIDNNGKVHVAFDLWFGYYDGGDYFWPSLCDGILYWNEDMPEGEYTDDYIVAPSHVYWTMGLDTIAKAPDPNGNGEIDWGGDDVSITYAGTYYSSLTTWPMLACDEDNNIYMTYSTIMEEYYKDDANPQLQHFRHVYGMAYDADAGVWLEPVNLVQETGLDNNTENVFATTAINVHDGMVHTFWQSDNEPGVTVWDSDPFTTNSMIYNSFPVGTFGIGVKEIQSNSTSSFTAYPNPVINDLKLDVEKGANIAVYDIAGNEVVTVENADVNTTISMANFAEGTYVVKVSDSKGVSAQKIIKK